MRFPRLLIGTALLSVSAAVVAAYYDQTFLDDYSSLQARQSGNISDFVYIAPDAPSRLADYPNGIAIDQPEILISPESKYKGGKPEDLASVAEMVRTTLANQLEQGGYTIAEQPGPGVLYLRVAVTDLALKKKKRGLLAYTPVGAVVKAGTDAIKGMMEKVDITGITLQAELLDGDSGEVLAAMVSPSAVPTGGKIAFEDLQSLVAEYGARMHCQLDNAQLSAEQRINCLDPEARAAR